jgi:hypothetical protein
MSGHQATEGSPKAVSGPPPSPAADEDDDEQAQYSSPSDPVILTVALKRDDGKSGWKLPNSR